jgi:hypothetical protein
MIFKRNSVNCIGKDVKVYCKFWKKFIETVSLSQEVNCGIFLNTGYVEAIESILGSDFYFCSNFLVSRELPIVSSLHLSIGI